MNDADAADARVAVVSVGTEAEPASAEHCAVASHAVAGAAFQRRQHPAVPPGKYQLY